MKRRLSSLMAASAAIFSPAHAADTAPVWTLYKGTAIVKPRVAYASADLCKAGGLSSLVPKAAKYKCQGIAVTNSVNSDLTVKTTTESSFTFTVTPPPVMHAGVHVDPAKIPKPVNFGSSTLDVRPTSEVAPVSDTGDFRTNCQWAMMVFDDPIVYPGQPGKSHLHTVFGNTGFSAATTPDSLRNSGNSTCMGGIANRSAYWVPTMLDGTGVPVIPDSIGVYYKSGLLDPSVIQPIPAGLRMIAGDPTNTTLPFDTSAARFKCIGGPNDENDQYGSQIPNCDAGAQVWQEVFFPQCWDGVNLDSPDHKSHMATPVPDPAKAPPFGLHCPSTHPIAIPNITFNVIYTVPTKGASAKWRLASDSYSTSLPGGYSSHGDWFNGWRDDIKDSWAKNCVQARKDCHGHLVGDGREMF